VQNNTLLNPPSARDARAQGGNGSERSNFTSVRTHDNGKGERAKGRRRVLRYFHAKYYSRYLCAKCYGTGRFIWRLEGSSDSIKKTAQKLDGKKK
jgi:hypothetical protein